MAVGGIAGDAETVAGVVFAAAGFAAGVVFAPFAAGVVVGLAAGFVFAFEAGVVFAAGVFDGAVPAFEGVVEFDAPEFKGVVTLAGTTAGMFAGTPVGTPETVLDFGSASLVEVGLAVSDEGTFEVFDESAGGAFSVSALASAGALVLGLLVVAAAGADLFAVFLSPFFGTDSTASSRSSASGPTRTADCIRAADADAQQANAMAVANNTFFMMHSNSLLAQAMRAAGQTAVGRFAGLGDCCCCRFFNGRGRFRVRTTLLCVINDESSIFRSKDVQRDDGQEHFPGDVSTRSVEAVG